MNREIKFRGKVADEPDEWVYGYLTSEDTIFQPKETEYTKCCGFGTFAVIPETVGQFTGLKDKNGKEIYEGDIVLYEDWQSRWEGGDSDSFINKGIIKYCEENCRFIVTEKETINDEDVLYEDNETLEVIGNICENSKLLEV